MSYNITNSSILFLQKKMERDFFSEKSETKVKC